MNGKCAKRIRFGALANMSSFPGRKIDFRKIYKYLKRSYKELPYHKRSNLYGKEGHSSRLRHRHSVLARMVNIYTEPEKKPLVAVEPKYFDDWTWEEHCDFNHCPSPRR